MNPRYRLIDDYDYAKETAWFYANEDAELEEQVEEQRRERERYEARRVELGLLPGRVT